MKGASKSASVNEEVPTLLEGGGKIEVLRINGSAETPVPNEDIGKFYSGYCYVVLYTYHSHERKEDYYLCSWIGKDSIEEDQKMATQLSTTMFKSLKGRPVLGRIYQGKEPPQFVAIFQHMIVLKGGLSSGYKNYIADKGLNDETYTGVALIRISGTLAHNNKAVQVEAVATSLNSNECFLLQSGSSIFSWHGSQSTVEQQWLAAKIAEFLKPGSSIKHVKEGTESSSFWFALGGKQSSSDVVKDAHLFAFSFNRGKFEVEEIYNFSQDDLLTEDILILDTHAEVFVWVGQSVDSEEKQSALDVGQKYVEFAASLEGLPLNVPLYIVTEGFEPCFFTTYFSWDAAKAIAQGNSFQKVMLFFDLGHASEAYLSDEDFKTVFNTEMEKSMEKSDAQFNTEKEKSKSDDVNSDKSVFIATLTGKVGWHTRTIKELHKVASVRDLSAEELSNLTKAYNKEIASLLNSWTILCTIENKDGPQYDQIRHEHFDVYKNRVGDDIVVLCKAFKDLLDSHSEETASSLQIKAKLCCYIINAYKCRQNYVQLVCEATKCARISYEEAISRGAETLGAAHPMLLQINLVAANFAVDILDDFDRARAIVQDAILKSKHGIGKLANRYIKDADVLFSTLMSFLDKLEKKNNEAVYHWIKENKINNRVLGLGLGEQFDRGAGESKKIKGNKSGPGGR